jgi:c-di-GMP-binding flagellar brake protein YcgR
MTVIKKELRRHQRILVPDGHPIRCQGAEPKVEGIVTVIGLGGMFIRTRNSQPYGAVLNLRIQNKFSLFDAQCTVRNVAENGLGVEFTSLSPTDEQKLKGLLQQLRPLP